MPLSRRTFLKTGALAALAVPRSHPPFRHGVASGDPLPDSVVLWTRLTPSPEATPGSGLGTPTPVTWEVARDAGFRDVVKRGRATTHQSLDHTLHIDPGGLEPDTAYHFRFRLDDGHASPTGRTRTAPPPDSTPGSLTLAVASCANWESGYFAAYSDIAARAGAGQLDLCVFLGDYLYEYARGQGALRRYEPPHELLTLADYRIRHGHYRTDPELQAAHAALPWVVTWDDHEIADNSWRGGAKNHTADEGAWQERRQAAMQAYLEWLPVRASGTPIYRTLRFGNLAELSMLDLRTYRDQDVYSYQSLTDPRRTMMGNEQFRWLQRRITTSDARWNLIGNSVMLAPMELGHVDPRVREALGVPFTGIPLNADQWDGFAADRTRLLQTLADKGTPALFLTGDIHTEWANRIMFRGEEIGVELVCSSVSAPNVDERLGLPADNPASHLAEQIIRDSNPQVRHVDLDSHGYSIAHLTADEVQLKWLRVDDVKRRGATVRETIGLTWRTDRGFTS